MKRIISLLIVLAMVMAVFAGCGSTTKDDNDPLTAAKDYIYALYKDKAEATASDYTVTSVVTIGETKYTVEWSVEIKNGDEDAVVIVDNGDGSVTVDVKEKNEEDVVYVLTATVKDENGKSETVSFNHKIPAYKEAGWAEYVAAADGDTVIVGGVVTAVIAKSKGNSSNCLYVQDSVEGGYYVYGMSDDPVSDLGIEVGMTVKVVGTRDTYSGTYEIKDAVVEVTDTSVKTVEPVDMTDVFTSAESLKAAELAGKQGMLVTIKNVEVTGEDTGSGYYKFKLGDKETYVRISSSVCPISGDDQTTLKSEHAAHYGYIANVTGVICVYDGAFYLTPVSANAFEYIGLPDLSDSEKALFELNSIELPTSIINDTEIELTLVGKTYSDVTIEWVSGETCAVVKDGKLTVTLPKTAVDVKLTATATCGEATETKEFTVAVSAAASGEVLSYGLQTSLKDGDKVILYNPGSGMAVSELDLEGNASYRAGEAVSVSKGVIKTNLSRLVWEVKKSGSGFQFVNDAGQTLSCTGRTLKIGDTDNVWSIESASSANCVYIVSTTGKGDSGDAYSIEWYSKYSEFSTYFYSESNESLFAMQLYVLGATPVSTDKPEVSTGEESKAEESKPAVSVDPSTGDSYKLATSLKDGDKVVIYNASVGLAISEEDLSETYPAYRKGVSVTVSNDTIKTATTTLVWEVKVVDGGYQFIADNGQTLSCTGRKLLLADTDNVWTISAAATANSFLIQSTTGKGDSGDPYTIEWFATYSEFTSYFYYSDSDAIYAMQFYVLG